MSIPDQLTNTSGSDDEENRNVVPLAPNLSRQFYLPLVLLVALGRVFRRQAALRMPELERAPTDLFKTFVNKLGHICDSAKGGDRVTAFAIMQLGSVRYYFTSNSRNEEAYQWTTYHIIDVLNTLGQAQDGQLNNTDGGGEPSLLFLQLLRQIIRFNQSRIRGYVCRMRENLDSCIQVAQVDESDDGQQVLHGLTVLSTLLEGPSEARSLDAFVDGSERVIRAIRPIFSPRCKEYLRLRTRHNTDREAPWVVVSHSIGRLLSYYYAVEILMSARRQWPELFVDFEVQYFPSAAPLAPTLAYGRLNAEIILRKMGNPDTTQVYRQHAATIENSGIPLDKSITTAISKGKFMPTVHAEPNLLQHILRLQRVLRTQGSEVPVFFNNERYIGCSKPVCRLCEVYFHHHPEGVTVREGHRNLYGEWRAPDVLAHDGEHAINERTMILSRMLPVIRDDVFLCLRERCAVRSPNDSHDTPTNVPLPDIGSSATQLGDLVTQMGQVDITDDA